MVVGLGNRLDRNLLHQTAGRAREARSENSRHPFIEHEQGPCRIPFNPNCLQFFISVRKLMWRLTEQMRLVRGWR